MPKKPKPQVLQTPYANYTTNTYGTASIADTPEAKAYLAEDIDIDPGAGRRTDLREQEMENRWNSAFMSGVPEYLRAQQQESERRKIESEGAAEAQQAEYARKLMSLERRRDLLPQIVQTGGQSTGYGSQILPPQQGGGFLSGLAGTALAFLPKI